ncbi:J domain-containing protein [Paraburkholderia saeva]|uniref:Chaperone protein DnaJ n=1 Tax=Paraburkholderia saeva TaxID=2777537 RepID=A0A9N8RVH7_9BURK|nr:J domain-containing protein [Paraburkholderia saeva]CAG4893182.1 Chaperone protein DnaJ [Paraburkholderia saeva]CAG4909115.1 Chaperone protein DnaJ [Paraburkholderia saeva]
MATLYDTLGVPASATGEEIKRAYRKAAMRWHPDRNAGHEEVARAAFQDVKNAYAILSDPSQREVYDAVYAEQMRVWEAHREREAREQAGREAAARAAAEAEYAERVAVAMRFADEGHNRDVVFGVLIGQQCEPGLAAQIAASAVALHASRQAPPVEEDVPATDDDVAEHAAACNGETRHARSNASADAPGGGLGTLWYQFLNGLRF